jgi:hypothetical protein
MEDFDHRLADATRRIAPEYFCLPIDGGDPVYRERVYSYELYHQLRADWPAPELCLYRVNGEVDKQGHIAMQNLGIRGQKPDLLIHQPGNMGGNHIVIEIKAAPSTSGKIRKDLETLAAFRAAGYDRALYLVYGEKCDARMVKRVEKFAAAIQNTAGIEIWLHKEADFPAALAAIVP